MGKAKLDIAQQWAELEDDLAADSFIVRLDYSNNRYTTQRLNTNRTLSKEYKEAVESLGKNDTIYKVSNLSLDFERVELVEREKVIRDLKNRQEEIRNLGRVEGTSVQNIIDLEQRKAEAIEVEVDSDAFSGNEEVKTASGGVPIGS